MKARPLLFFILAAVVATAKYAAAEPVLNAYLYNPAVNQIVLTYPYDKPAETTVLKPTLTFRGDGFADGDYKLSYTIEAKGKLLFKSESPVKIRQGSLDLDVELKDKLPTAERVSWRLAGPAGQSQTGIARLAWSRFHGRVRYLSGVWRSTYIELVPIRWGTPGAIQVPVADDGTFDALVPARVYAAVNVNGGGYTYDAMERWAWNYDLRRDREDLFTIGTTEIYGARAFDILGGPPTLFVFFRPSSLGRIHRFDINGDRIMSDAEKKATWDALKRSPTEIGPELSPNDIKIFLDGKPLKIERLDQIPEADLDGRWQVDYLVQCSVPKEAEGVKAGTWYREVKIEVTSHDMLRGQPVTDFGQGSVDILLSQ